MLFVDEFVTTTSSSANWSFLSCVQLEGSSEILSHAPKSMVSLQDSKPGLSERPSKAKCMTNISKTCT